jgi:hypothetical protein
MIQYSLSSTSQPHSRYNVIHDRSIGIPGATRDIVCPDYTYMIYEQENPNLLRE